MGEKGEGSGGKGGGNWEWGTPLSTPSPKNISREEEQTTKLVTDGKRVTKKMKRTIFLT